MGLGVAGLAVFGLSLFFMFFANYFITDNGNQIIDVLNLNFDVPYETEGRINKIPGVVENGIFSARKADCIVVSDGTKTYEL